MSARELHALGSLALALTSIVIVGCSGSGIGPDSFGSLGTGGSTSGGSLASGGAAGRDTIDSGEGGTSATGASGGAPTGDGSGGPDSGSSGSGGAGSGSGGTAGRAGASGSSGVDAAPDGTGGSRLRDGGSTDAISGGTCPGGITLNGQNSTRQYGDMQGSFYADVCPGNEVVIGYLGNVDSRFPTSIAQLQAVCGTLSVGSSPGCAVRIVRDSTPPQRGGTGTSAFMQMCPPNEVVVGFQGRAGTLLNQISFTCAPLAVSRTEVGYAVSLGATQVTEPSGGSGGRTFKDACSDGQIARGNNIFISNNGARGVVESFGLICGAPRAR